MPKVLLSGQEIGKLVAENFFNLDKDSKYEVNTVCRIVNGNSFEITVEVSEVNEK